MDKKQKDSKNISDVNIAFITDDNYIVPTVVTIQSLIAKSSLERRYNIFVLCDNVSKQNKKYFTDCAQFCENINIVIIDADTSVFDKVNSKNDNMYMVASTSALLKFNLGNILKDKDKVLYLDGDLFIRCDVAEIYDINLGDNYVSAVRDLPQIFRDKPLIGGDIAGVDYFNSGVMLLNLKKMRKENAFDKLVEIKMNRPNDNLMDQNVLNVLFKGQVIQLNYLYNVCYCNYERSTVFNYAKLKDYYDDPCKDFSELTKKAKIIHFSSFAKPWIYFDTPFVKEWTKCYFNSPVKNLPLNRVSQNAETNITFKTTKKIVADLNKNDKKFSTKIVPIVFCTNHTYVPFTMVSIQSIKENIKSPEHLYKIYIFHDEEIFVRDKYLLENMSEGNVVVQCLDVRNLIKKESLYSRDHFSKQMFYRWLIPEVLPHYSKVIYLDCDIVVNADIRDLYSIPLDGKTLAAAINELKENTPMYNYVKNVLHLNPDQYINSGILVFNTQKFANKNIKEKGINLIIKNKTFLCPDQDALNLVLKDDIKILSSTWNYQWLSKQRTINDRYGKKHNIIHFTTGDKPWKFAGYKTPLAEYFWKYARNTPIYEEIIYSTVNNYINIKLNESKSKSPKKKKKITKIKVSRILSWPFRIVGKFSKDFFTKGPKTSFRNVGVRVKYAFNRVMGKVDIDNRQIIKPEPKKDYNYFKNLSPKKYAKELESWFNSKMNENMNINNPKTFNQKIQWLKLYDSTIIKSHLTDKWLAKEYVKSILGEKYIIKTLGVYDKFDDIDFEKLPNQFVIKSTHGSGHVIIIKDKSTIDMAKIKEKVNKWLNINYAWDLGLELHYANIIPRIIIEEYVAGINDDLYDYKVVCSKGEILFIWVDTERFTHHKRNLFDTNWKQLNATLKCPLNTNEIPKPKKLKELLDVSKKLSKNFANVRCDFYIMPNDELKFGELTFTSCSGVDPFDPYQYDIEFGKKVQLPNPTQFKKLSRKQILKSEKEFLESLKKKEKTNE